MTGLNSILLEEIFKFLKNFDSNTGYGHKKVMKWSKITNYMKITFWTLFMDGIQLS